MYSRIVVLVCVLAGTPLSLSAQQRDTAQQQDSARRENTVPRPLWQRASGNNWYLRLIVTGADTIVGRVRYSRGQARIDGDPVPETILLIERRIVRGNGALIGGLIGFVVGGFMGSGLASSVSENEPGAGLTGFGVGGGIGGMLGVLSGQIAAPGRVEWEPVWMHRSPDR